ncbi:MAG: metallophosphoesterase, partial [Chthoniobacteraceae bacterium]
EVPRRGGGVEGNSIDVAPDLSAPAGPLPALRAETRKVDPDRWALFSDTHIDADPATIARNVPLADHLRTAVAGVQALATAPAGLFINGDCSLDRGLPGDYATLSELLRPLVGNVPLHLLLGNHDDREVFYTSLKEHRPAAPVVASKHVSVVEGARANWFLLDSLDVTKQTPGLLGDEQRAWLAKALDQRTDKPALIMLHHNPVAATTGKVVGLVDTPALLELVLPRRHVKALFFGHTHVWRQTVQDGLHLVNLPAVAYPFNPAEVTGWIDCRLREGGMTLEVRAHDEKHAAHGKPLDFAWRTA